MVTNQNGYQIGHQIVTNVIFGDQIQDLYKVLLTKMVTKSKKLTFCFLVTRMVTKPRLVTKMVTKKQKNVTKSFLVTKMVNKKFWVGRSFS